jgi:Fe-S cluster assembly ATPase SufC
MKRFLDRDVNVGFSGGRLNALNFSSLQPRTLSLYLLDEPSPELTCKHRAGRNAIKELLAEGMECPGERGTKGKSALIITHTGQVLDYVQADRDISSATVRICVRKSPENAGRDKKQRVSGVYYMQTDKVSLKKRARVQLRRKPLSERTLN